MKVGVGVVMGTWIGLMGSPSAQPAPNATDLDRDSLAVDVPLPERTFYGVLGRTPSAGRDSQGVGFDGASSLENRYLLDGIDITDLRYASGAAGFPLELLGRVDVATASVDPALGRAVGATVELHSRPPTDDLRGSVFGTFAPGVLSAHALATGAPSVIDVASALGYDASFGFELSGTLVPHMVRFSIGVAPQLGRTDETRTINGYTDCRRVLPDGTLSPCDPKNADGLPDRDPKTGQLLVSPIDSSVRHSDDQSVPVIGRLDVDAAPTETGSLTIAALPVGFTQPGLYGSALSGIATNALETDVGARWTSRLPGVTLRTQLGWHRAELSTGALDPSVANTPEQVYFSDLAHLAVVGGESAAVVAGCKGGPGTASGFIDPCPVEGYAVGGPGITSDDVQDRRTAKLIATTHVANSELELGGEIVRERETVTLDASGGGAVDNFDDPITVVRPDTAPVTEHSTQLAGFVGDTYEPDRHVVLHAALRYDEQWIDGARMWLLSPRMSAAIDPTGERRTWLVATFEREIDPLALGFAYAIDPRAGGDIRTYDFGGCAPVDPRTGLPDGTRCIGSNAYNADVSTAPAIHIGSDLRPQYDDRLELSAQHEILATQLSATYVHSSLHDVIEDTALAGDVVVNPGVTGDTGVFTPPTRVYDALQLRAARAFGALRFVASYTFSRTRGSYPGEVADDLGEFAPHLTSAFDGIDNAINRTGALPQDRPHRIAIDAAYTLPLDGRDALAFGARVRALSGTPELVTGMAQTGELELLLPRDALGRTPWTAQLDVQLGYYRRLTHRKTLQLYVDVFNVTNEQSVEAVESQYAGGLSTTRPISGGSYADLLWAREQSTTGAETAIPVSRLSGFRDPTLRYAPLETQFGFALGF